MIFVFGGAYQGKRDYAKAAFGLADGDFFVCREGDTALDLSQSAVDGLHRWVLAVLRAGGDPPESLRAQLNALRGKVILCDDITGGVVPAEAELRAWREAAGRCMALLAAEADCVIRVFCGLPLRLK